MEVRLLTLGVFEYFKEEKSKQYNSVQINKFLSDKIIQFDFLQDSDSILPKHAYFNPSRVEISFSNELRQLFNEFIIIKKQPIFYCFVIPYPSFVSTAIKTGFKTYDRLAITLNNSLDRKSRLNFIQWDLCSTIEIDFTFNEDNFINDFTRRHCHPIFVESQEELEVLIADYIHFMKDALGITLTVSSLSKMIIPYFNLDESEISEVRNIEYLPF